MNLTRGSKINITCGSKITKNSNGEVSLRTTPADPIPSIASFKCARFSFFKKC